jgi:hypothetical protein
MRALLSAALAAHQACWCAAHGSVPPSLASLAPPSFVPIETCPPLDAAPAPGAGGCPGWELPQLDGMVKGDNATLCFHLGCCYSVDNSTGRGACHAATPASAAAATNSEWFSANQPLPSLSNTRGTVQLPLETPDALAVDCVYFPPMFGTCDGSRSDSRDDRDRDPTGPIREQPTFGGATQKLRVNGVPLVSTAFRWTPAELVRRASAAGMPWLQANSSVRMVLAESQILLTLAVRNGGGAPERLHVSFEIPFVSRIYSVRDPLRPNLFVLAGIFLCDVCSCHEILRAQRTRVGGGGRLRGRLPNPAAAGAGQPQHLGLGVHAAQQRDGGRDAGAADGAGSGSRQRQAPRRRRLHSGDRGRRRRGWPLVARGAGSGRHRLVPRDEQWPAPAGRVRDGPDRPWCGAELWGGHRRRHQARGCV